MYQIYAQPKDLPSRSETLKLFNELQKNLRTKNHRFRFIIPMEIINEKITKKLKKK